MKTNDQTVEIINDLIQINNDRIQGYEKAASEVQDAFNAEIKSVFFKMAEESRIYKNDLINAVLSLGGEPANETTTSGKIYRAWMDMKASFTGHDIKAILESCEFGEDAALKAYQKALQTDVDLSPELTALIAGQRQLLRASHDRIKRYRDEFNTVDNIN